MEPLKPDLKKRILETNPEAAPEEIEEYERLLSERFTTDPDLAMDPKHAELMVAKNSRLAELHKKLFLSGGSPRSTARR